MPMSSHFGFKPSWSPTREIWDVELDVLIVCTHIPDTFEATTPDRVTSALKHCLQNETTKREDESNDRDPEQRIVLSFVHSLYS